MVSKHCILLLNLTTGSSLKLLFSKVVTKLYKKYLIFGSNRVQQTQLHTHQIWPLLQLDSLLLEGEMQIDCHVYDFIGTLLGGDVVGRMWGFNWHLAKEGSVAIAGPAGFKSISNVTIIIGRSLLACQTLWSGSMNRVGGLIFKKNCRLF